MSEQEAIMRFHSSRFGDLEIPESRMIRAPEGIIGFPDITRYVLLDPSAGQSLFLWLQAVDNPDLAFILANPLDFIPGYALETSEPDLQRIKISEKTYPALFVIVTVPMNDPDKISANLLAPLLYFEDENSIYQVVLESGNWPLRQPLLASDDPDSGEVQ
jgi:flagellar assembly factor FliW